MTEILMPRLSDSMEQGTILTWLVGDGETVIEGQELVEIETDKATMTYAAEGAGVLELVVAPGETVAVGEAIARLRDGSPAPGPPADAAAPATIPDPPTADTPAPDRPAPDPPADTPTPDAPATASQPPAATPMARRIAALHGVALGDLVGSGPRGRIVRTDVLRAAGLDALETARAAPETARDGATDGSPPPDRDHLIQPTRLQSLIARRMAEAKATIPHFQVETEVEMTAALAFRQALKEAAGDRPAPSLNDLIVKACALALRRFPQANGSWADGAFRLHAQVNVGIAVAAEDALVVPVIPDADALTLGQIALLARQLATAVRDGTVTPPQLAGGTFTVSNLGMYGMTAITPVINPPQAAILGVGAIRETLGRAADGTIVDRRPLTLRLSCDHRILYGAQAAEFLAAIRDTLQAPVTLAL